MLFRSLRSLAARALAAGAASALALTLFNAAQPSLGSHKIHPGTLKNVKVALAPAVDSRGRPTLRSATLPLRGAEPGAGSLQVAPAPAPASTPAPAPVPVQTPAARVRLQSDPVAVGGARFVGFSWPGRPGSEEQVGTVWLRAWTTAGWSAWREVEQSSDGPDPTSREYRTGRVYSDGQWLDAGTAEVQVRFDPPAAAGTPAATPRAGAGTSTAAGPAGGLEAHMITPDMAPTPGTEPARAGSPPPRPCGRGS